MNRDKYVLTVDEDAQGLIINALIMMMNGGLQEGMDVSEIESTILDVCKAPTKKELKRGVAYER